MKYSEFREVMQNKPFFRTNSFSLISKKPKLIQDSLVEWIKKGYVLRLKRGLYTLRAEDRLEKYSKYFFANHICSPSYVSLEAALEYYGFIPEAVRAVTSITTKKTCDFENSYGRFIYKHVKKELFTGFVKEKDSYGNDFLMASREKALLDLLYLKTGEHRRITRDLLEEGYRLQWLGSVDLRKLEELAKLYNTKKMTEAAKVLADYIQEEWK